MFAQTRATAAPANRARPPRTVESLVMTCSARERVLAAEAARPPRFLQRTTRCTRPQCNIAGMTRALPFAALLLAACGGYSSPVFVNFEGFGAHTGGLFVVRWAQGGKELQGTRQSQGVPSGGM